MVLISGVIYLVDRDLGYSLFKLKKAWPTCTMKFRIIAIVIISFWRKIEKTKHHRSILLL